MRRGATIGANATVICGHTIGQYAFIGAGAVVTGDVPDHALMVGVPARQILARQGEIVRHPLHRIVDLVRHAGRQPPHRGEALGVEEPPLQLAHASLLARARLQAPAPPALLERQAA